MWMHQNLDVGHFAFDGSANGGCSICPKTQVFDFRSDKNVFGVFVVFFRNILCYIMVTCPISVWFYQKHTFLGFMRISPFLRSAWNPFRLCRCLRSLYRSSLQCMPCWLKSWLFETPWSGESECDCMYQYFSIRLVRLPFKVILVTRIWSCQVSVANVARAEHVSGPILAQPTTGMPF